jgi:hypothetical protein
VIKQDNFQIVLRVRMRNLLFRFTLCGSCEINYNTPYCINFIWMQFFFIQIQLVVYFIFTTQFLLVRFA